MRKIKKEEKKKTHKREHFILVYIIFMSVQYWMPSFLA
jgi:hypothetical protein